MSTDASTSRIGTEIAGFRIESVLGRGGMSVVYLAEQVRLGRKVALKVLASHVLAFDESFRERFLQESHLAAHLDHPNVIPIYDAGEAEDCLYIAMGYVAGRDLARVLEQDGPLGLGRAIFILEQVASALDAAHEKGLVHRDVKPANVLLVADSDRIYLTDFGVAKPTTSAGLTRTGFFIGTPDYCAPEQIEGAPVDARTDVYALGAVLYAVLSGSSPYARDTEVAVLQAHLLEPPPRLSEVRGDLPRGLDLVIGTAMAKSKDERYGTCGDLVAAARAAALDRPVSLVGMGAAASVAAAEEPGASGERPVAGPPAPPPPEASDAPPEATPPAPRRDRTPLLIGVLAAAVVALAAALGVVVLTQGGSSPGAAATGPTMTRTTTFVVPLASGAEVPRTGLEASGTARVEITGQKVCWHIALHGVANPTMAHIHQGGSTVSGPILVWLGPAFSPQGCTTAPAAAVRQILAHPAADYVNVHSRSFPDGAVRGQLAGSTS